VRDEIAPQLRTLESALEEDPELHDETPPSILLYCAVAFLIAAEGRSATLTRAHSMLPTAAPPQAPRLAPHRNGA
jgi:hypothetical protein